MDWKELAGAFAAKHNVEGLTVGDGVAALEIDGMAIALAGNEEGVIASAEIGAPPPEKPEVFAHLLLEANMEAAAGGGHVFAKNPGDGAYVLIGRLVDSSGDIDAFETALGHFTDRLELWRRLLADFRPAAQEAVAASAAAQDEVVNALRSGFLRV